MNREKKKYVNWVANFSNFTVTASFFPILRAALLGAPPPPPPQRAYYRLSSSSCPSGNWEPPPRPAGKRRAPNLFIKLVENLVAITESSWSWREIVVLGGVVRLSSPRLLDPPPPPPPPSSSRHILPPSSGRGPFLVAPFLFAALPPRLPSPPRLLLHDLVGLEVFVNRERR